MRPQRTAATALLALLVALGVDAQTIPPSVAIDSATPTNDNAAPSIPSEALAAQGTKADILDPLAIANLLAGPSSATATDASLPSSSATESSVQTVATPAPPTEVSDSQSTSSSVQTVETPAPPTEVSDSQSTSSSVQTVATPAPLTEASGSQSKSSSTTQTADVNLLRTTNTIATTDTSPRLASSSGKNSSTTTKRPSTTSPPAATSSGSSSGMSDESGSDYLDPTLSYACVCKDVRKVSLMSASDYCLSPAAVIGNKCGNPAVAEKGECPVAGAQPCQDTGHVLTNDSICAYDKRDDTYKCVASKEDLYIQKYGKKRKPLNSTTSPSGGSSSAPTMAGHSVLKVVLLVASLVVGLSAAA